MNNKEIKNENHSGFTKVKMSVVFLCLVVAMVYLGIINASAVKGYEIKKVEQKIEELKKENKQLQIQEAELNSFYNIKDNIGNLNMVEVKDVVYIDDNEGAVALKK
ncbi:MAG: hypothetical protein UR66_C0002G0117 [Candidatus Moranbacteria bacterium GW2011_GWE1_35_17]|nr:MAG: hypothetical protein UR66_C0002G0117 [Candidatus Moranbacteria bacterium GW2011_GWE1_35_17]KKP84503.1 MAG: hypothetical protein UR82_C0004G0019 [Candidatus Moranbacteria bacterium GW2011_GWF1_35_5]